MTDQGWVPRHRSFDKMGQAAHRVSFRCSHFCLPRQRLETPSLFASLCRTVRVSSSSDATPPFPRAGILRRCSLLGIVIARADRTKPTAQPQTGATVHGRAAGIRRHGGFLSRPMRDADGPDEKSTKNRPQTADPPRPRRSTYVDPAHAQPVDLAPPP